MMISLSRKFQNVGIDILESIKSIIMLILLYSFLSFTLFLVVSPIISYFAGSITVLVITIISILVTSSIYFHFARNLESYNPLKWYVWSFGKSVFVNEEYYYDNDDEIKHWLSDTFSSYAYIIKTYQPASLTINGDSIVYKKQVMINFLKSADACEFKLIFNKST